MSDLEEIKLKYNKALVLIKHENNYKGATDILYKEMSHKLYDLSLDIMYNQNEIYQDQELRTLILQVDKLLVNYSSTLDEDQTNKLYTNDDFYPDVEL
tara:strand:+ start:4209 stop:4502 length:294 start_codon:yes stop_codon:yes gene_type:complete